MKLFIVFMLLLISCTSLDYVSDKGFIVSAQANSPEFLVNINNSVCKDMDSIVGLCSKRVYANKDINFSIDAKPYNYRFQFTCSKIDNDFSKDILIDKKFEFSIPSSKLLNVGSFTCIGEVFPTDRDDTVSAKFEVRFVVISENYIKREDIYMVDNTLVLGQYAYKSNVLINGKWKHFSKKTLIKLKKNEKVEMAYSESERMRFNYFNF